MTSGSPLHKRETRQPTVCRVPRWQFLKSKLVNLTYDQFLFKLKSDRKGVCLDVRTAEEFKEKAIANALNIDYLSSSLADHLELLDFHKNYYIYCRTGRRSLRVCILMQNMGFTVFNLDQGISEIG